MKQHYTTTIIMVLGIAIAISILVAAVRFDAQAQQTVREEPRIELLAFDAGGTPDVYVLTDRGGCQYLIVRGGQGTAITPRNVAPSSTAGPMRQAGCRVRP